MNQAVKRFDNYCHAVDGKHPQRSFAHQGKFTFSKRIKGGEKDFQTPSGKTTNHKIFSHRDSMLFFSNCIMVISWKIPKQNNHIKPEIWEMLKEKIKEECL